MSNDGNEDANQPPRRGGHEQILHQILAQKILRGHLQDRHQLIDRGLAELNGRSPEEAARGRGATGRCRGG